MFEFLNLLAQLILLLIGFWALRICAVAFWKGFKKGYNKNNSDD